MKRYIFAVVAVVGCILAIVLYLGHREDAAEQRGVDQQVARNIARPIRKSPKGEKPMRHSTRWMLLLFAVSSLGSGCSKTERAFVVDGAGFSALTPAPETQAFIVNRDLPFARQVLAHNATCARMAGCQK